MYKQLLNAILFIYSAGVGFKLSAQEVLKIGSNPYTINTNAVLDIESNTKGFLPPRMTKAQRNAIASPPSGLQIWCTDCNGSTQPSSGQLYIYIGSGWAPFETNIFPIVKTGKRSDEINKPVRNSSTSATITGILLEINGAIPIETGIVYRPITNNDFATLPILEEVNGIATTPNYKLASTSPVTKEGGTISIKISSIGKTPYYFRTYAKSYLGIGYGNPIVFNIADPSFSGLSVSSDTALEPTFNGILNVNAGTLSGAVTEYGYYSGTTASPTTNKVVLSTPALLTDLDTKLNVENFTANPTVTLTVPNFNTASTDQQYFRFYVVANGQTIYSADISFKPTANAVTGGAAIATLVSIIKSPGVITIGDEVTQYFTATFKVTKTGSYSAFYVISTSGATKGLILSDIIAGKWTTIGTNTLTFPLTGNPTSSLEGNSFIVSRLSLSFDTGPIKLGQPKTGDAICDDLHETKIVDIVSISGKTWMDRNLGASRAAISAADYYAYGCLYQWGRGNDDHASIKHTDAYNATAYNGFTSTQSNEDTPKHSNFIVSSVDWRTPKNDNLWQNSSGTNNPCPTGYRVPTSKEFQNEITLYNVTDSNSAYNSKHKFVLGGTRTWDNATVYDQGNFGSYWTSTVYESGAYRHYYDTQNKYVGAPARSWGWSIRCIKN
ncbi:hypothetical protein ACHRVZ_15545 [Flavobacterium sp. FlaQc-57]|uniref:hypothetical protein n=1 Tax=Flavobacterium sp. FlaQc-57 TaxID=3374186 RepID=UPI00375756A0